MANDRGEQGQPGDLPRLNDPGDPSERTLAGRIAQELQNEIVRKRWPIGEALGSEAELMERFGVSRSVIREARRVLESRLVAKPKPGPGGGLVVTAPDFLAFTEVARLFLDYRGFRPEDLYEVWVAVETVLIRRVVPNLTDDELKELYVVSAELGDVRDPREVSRTLHTEIGRLSKNPIAELLLQVLADLSRFHSVWFNEEGLKRLVEQHDDLVAAMAARDGERAAAQVRLIFDDLQSSESAHIDYFYSPPGEEE